MKPHGPRPRAGEQRARTQARRCSDPKAPLGQPAHNNSHTCSHTGKKTEPPMITGLPLVPIPRQALAPFASATRLTRPPLPGGMPLEWLAFNRQLRIRLERCERIRKQWWPGGSRRGESAPVTTRQTSRPRQIRADGSQSQPASTCRPRGVWSPRPAHGGSLGLKSKRGPSWTILWASRPRPARFRSQDWATGCQTGDSAPLGPGCAQQPSCLSARPGHTMPCAQRFIGFPLGHIPEQPSGLQSNA